MLKRFSLILLFLLFQSALAYEIPVKITPAMDYTTVNNNIKNGDFLDFITTEDVLTFKKGTQVKGLLSERLENGFAGKVATLYCEQFQIEGQPLEGIIYKKGNSHNFYFDNWDLILALPLKILFLNSEVSYVRGGEAFLRTNKDVFTVYLEVK